MLIRLLAAMVLLAGCGIDAQGELHFQSSTGNGQYAPEYAMDGKMDTRWSSDFSDDQWWEVRMDAPRMIVGMILHWETAYGRDYRIEVLDDAGQWITVNQTENGDGGTDAIYFGLKKVFGIRLTGSKRGTGWGYSLWDIELLGPEWQRSAYADSSSEETAAEAVMDGQIGTYWQAGDTDATLTIGSEKPMATGGLKIDWAQSYSPPCKIEMYQADGTWKTIVKKPRGVSRSEDVFFDAIETPQLRLVFQATEEPVRIAEIHLKQPGESWNPVRHFEMLAQRMPDGMFPGWLRREQAFWTVTGLPGSFNESLIDEYGRVESGLRSFSITPIVLKDKMILSPKAFERSQSLAQGWAPLPEVIWHGHDVGMRISAITVEPDVTLVRYRVKNEGASRQKFSLLLAVRPLPINPPWQHGGYAACHQASWDSDKTLRWNDSLAMRLVPKGDFATLYGQGAHNAPMDISDLLAKRISGSDTLQGEDTIISAGIRYDFDLDTGASETVLAILPNDSHYQGSLDIDGDISSNADAYFDNAKKQLLRQWNNWTGDWSMSLPDKRLEQLIRSNLAYLLINADGPAVQPGSRNYNSSWIRDGAISATAMLRFGLFDRVKAYVNWFSDLIKDDGFVPFLVDTRTGEMEWFAKTWQEYDSFGQYAFLVRQAVEITDDTALGKRCWPKVASAMRAMERLRDQRLTEDYVGTEFYGILPESNSHEGYFPGKHSYWDDFWGLRGLQDAQALAEHFGTEEQVNALAVLEKDFRKNVLASIAKVRERDGLATLPACAELGDFDPTSTAIAIMAANERDTLPTDALTATYDRYMRDSRDRAAMEYGTRPTYTPYEVRNISALIRFGRRDDALMLLNYFIEDGVRPAAWNHLAEVVHGDPRTPSYIGDMPHTWVGAGLINAIRDMFVYEDDGALVLAAGIDPAWYCQGVAVGHLQTWWGPISYTISQEAGQEALLRLNISQRPPRGVRVPSGMKLDIIER